jgi:GIY-YIG catalytic domain-containing protein
MGPSEHLLNLLSFNPPSEQIAALLAPTKLWTRTEVLANPCPVPASAGVYAWFFSGWPQGIPTDGLVRSAGLTLLYVGISPKRPGVVGNPSRQTLRSRLRYHFQGNAEGSTLRLSLGCLLSEDLGIELRRVGSGRRMTFGAGERVLSDWLERNARVAWLACDEPWRIEEQMIRSVSLPLNLDQNRHHTFHSDLSARRRAANARARELPIV